MMLCRRVADRLRFAAHKVAKFPGHFDALICAVLRPFTLSKHMIFLDAL